MLAAATRTSRKPVFGLVPVLRSLHEIVDAHPGGIADEQRIDRQQ